MKVTNLIVSIATGLCMSMAINAHADVLQYLTFTVTSYTQRTISDNGTNTIAAPPKVQTHNTTELLKTLAQDKNLQGNWPSNTFPVGAKLAAGNDGIVVAVGTNVLVDVSDIMSFSNGANEIFSGKRSDLTGLANPATTRLQIGRLDFDDTGINGSSQLKFYLQGIVSQVETDSVPSNGTYTSSQAAKLSNGTGEGTSNGTPFILSGTITATGRGKQTLQ